MAARKAKGSEKSVLSRQEIAQRKRALAEKKLQTGGAGRRALLGVAVLAVSVLGLIAVATFDARDRVGPGYQNAAGLVGHLLAEALRGAFGVMGYLPPLSGIYAAMVVFVGEREKSRWPQVLSGVLLSLSAAVLAHLWAGDVTGLAHPPGGAVGAGLGGLLVGLFSTVGTVVLVTALCAAALIVGTQYAFLRLCSLAWAGAQVLGRRVSEAALAFWAQQREAMEERRKRAEEAKAEEAAFLAQLEADEEELAEAEREAAEADAMAEEALRLAREAEAQKALPAPGKKRGKEPVAALPAVAQASGAAAEPGPDAGAARAGRTPALVVGGRKVGAEPAPAAARGHVPSGDPAWAAQFAAPQAAPDTASAPPPVVAEGKRRERPAVKTPPAPAAAAEAAPAAATATATAATLAAGAASAATAATANAAVPTPAAAAALARMPLIVEPKAPPKPTAPKNAEQFEFVGDRKSFSLPPLDVLEWNRAERNALDKDAFLVTAEKLRAKLADFGIVGEVVEIRPGPVVTMYEFLPGPGIKVSKIASLSDDLAMAMEAMRVRIVAPIPGKGVVGIEVPNKDRETVYLKEIAEQDAFQKSPSKLTMCMGKDIEGMPYVLDLAKAPHLLIAGTTGSGKSVAVNAMIMSLLLKSTPEEVRFIMVDPKMLELSVYEGIPHLLLPVVTDPKKAALALRWAVEEMERRYQMLSEAGVRNIAGFNKLVEQQAAGTVDAAPAPKKDEKKRKLRVVDVAPGETEDEALARAEAAAAETGGVPAPEADELRADVGEDGASAEAAPEPAAKEPKKQLTKLPYIVVIIDELADLMMVASREVETYVARLAQMARAAGIHLMVATQRPSTDVVTGVIKANFPTRITFMLRSKPDSMTILGTIGAEALLGMGDMLVMPPTSAHLQRVHGAYVSENEIKQAVDHLRAQGKPVYDENILKPREEEGAGDGGAEDELSDELYDQALAAVGDMRQVSISMLQRKMRIGYNRAARMIERMERDGVVGPADGAKPREVLIRAVGEMPGAGAM